MHSKTLGEGGVWPRVKAAAVGALAGGAGTVAMDALWYERYRRSGGQSRPLVWEFGAHPESWEQASAPGRVGKLLIESATHRPVPVERAGTLMNVMHWVYGPLWGAQYGAWACGGVPAGELAAGLAFGATVWAGDYVVLPLLRVYQPIWRYEPKDLFDDLSAHLLYGVATAISFGRLWGRGRG